MYFFCLKYVVDMKFPLKNINIKNIFDYFRVEIIQFEFSGGVSNPCRYFFVTYKRICCFVGWKSIYVLHFLMV